MLALNSTILNFNSKMINLKSSGKLKTYKLTSFGPLRFLSVDAFITKEEATFAKSIYSGSFETKDVFPYPGTLTEAERHSLKTMVTPIDDFFKEAKIKGTKETEKNESLIKSLWDMGLFGMQMPQPLGGLGLSNSQLVRLNELVGAHDLGVAMMLGSHQSIGFKGILHYGNDKQKAEYLPRVSNGEMAAFCLTEDGSNVDNMKLVLMNC